MVKDIAHATCAMLNLCKKSDHILEKHWKELHLPRIGAADLVTMLSQGRRESRGGPGKSFHEQSTDKLYIGVAIN